MKLVNKTWHRLYTLVEDLEAGILLTGAEVKSLQAGRAKLEAAYARYQNHELWLRNMEIFRYQFDGSPEYDPFRMRKLLLSRKELLRWETKVAGQPGLTIIPIEVYSKGNRLKVRLALVKGRNDTEKRRREKDLEIKRKDERELREYAKMLK